MQNRTRLASDARRAVAPTLAVIAALAASLLLSAATDARSAATDARSAGRLCCKVEYLPGKKFRVSGTVRFKGTFITASFPGAGGGCSARADKGKAFLRSYVVDLRSLPRGKYTLQIVSKHKGRILYTASPKFYVRGLGKRERPREQPERPPSSGEDAPDPEEQTPPPPPADQPPAA